MIRGSQKRATFGVVPGIALDLNPFAQRVVSARILRDWIIERGRIIHKSNSQYMSATFLNSGYQTWRVVNFRFTRASGAESCVIEFLSDGKVYRRRSAELEEIFPAGTGFNTLNDIPFVGVLSNQMFFSDGIASYVYDGRSVRAWGLARPSAAPAKSAIGAGSLTEATGLKAAVTWVVEDEQGNRIHESSRSDTTAFQALAAENLRVDITALTPPAAATHWSAYVSELDGSDVYRRAATTPIYTLTVDISSLPASTSPEAPIRNDPPPPSRVGAVAKNRIFLFTGNTLVFSALGEVVGLLNGSGPESFCGYGSTSISDIANSDFLDDREGRAVCEHEDIIFAFSERRGFAYIGELTMLDNRSPRSLVKLQEFTEGCAGPDAICSTPYGLVWFTPSRKLWMWSGGTRLIDLGEPIQTRLDTILGTDLSKVKLAWYSANGRQWLLLSLACAEAGIAYAIPPNITSQRTFVYDFMYPSPRSDRDTPDPGSWLEWSENANQYCIYHEPDGFPMLLGASASGFVGQLDSFFQPAHLNASCVLTKTALVSATTNFNGAQGILQTGLLLPSGDNWTTVDYLSLTLGSQEGIDPAASVQAATAITLWVDPDNPDAPSNDTSAISLAYTPALTTAESRVWLQPEASGNTNIGGAFGKQFVIKITADANDTRDIGDGTGRTKALYVAIYKMGLVWSTQKETAE